MTSRIHQKVKAAKKHVPIFSSSALPKIHSPANDAMIKKGTYSRFNTRCASMREVKNIVDGYFKDFL